MTASDDLDQALRERAAAWVDQLPYNGEWWKSSSRDRFLDVYAELHRLGVRPDQIESVLEDLYGAVANEFGA